MKYRKRNLLIIAILLIYMIICVPVNAQMEPEHSQTMLTDILKDVNQTLVDELKQFERVDEELESIDFDNAPIMVIKPLFYSQLPSMSSLTMQNGSVVRFVILQNDPIYIEANRTEGTLFLYDPYNSSKIPKYVQDLLAASATQSFLGQNCSVNNVICMDGERSHQGILLIFETSNGKFIHFYDHIFAEPIELSWDDFLRLLDGFQAYLHSLPDNTLGQPGFSEYVQNPEKYKPRTPFWHYLVIAAGAVATVAGVIFIGIQCRKRYLRRKYAYFDIEI